jgi:uncharacterized protein (DUF433 family)
MHARPTDDEDTLDESGLREWTLAVRASGRESALNMAVHPDIERLTSPRYTYAEADRLAGVSRGTARRWLTGYSYRDATGTPVELPPITPGGSEAGVVSFLDAVELVAIGGLKKAGFSTRAIRQIVRNCQEILGVQRPLTMLKFKTGGRDVFVDQGDVLVEVGRRERMQAWDEVLAPFLANLDYTHEVASRWWPLGKDVPIVVDPDYGHGLPVVQGSGVRTEIIRERAEAGDLIQQIARDFNLDCTEVERALQFELKRAA